MDTEEDFSAALVQSAEAGDTATLRSLLEAGVSVDTEGDSMDGDSRGSYPLHLAALRGDVEAVQLLLDHGAGVGQYNDCSLLYKPSFRGHIGVVKLLTDHGADPKMRDFMYTTQVLTMVAKDFELLQASVEVNLNIVRLLIDAGHDIDTYDDNGSSALMLAAQYQPEELIDLLLEEGANVNFRPRNSKTGETVSSSVIASCGPIHVLERLLDNGAEIGREEIDFLAAFNAARFGRVDCLSFLSERGAIIRARDIHGRTALHEAAKVGKTNAIEFLLDMGLDIELKSIEKGMTPLHEAAHLGKSEAVQLLLDRGANINALDSRGESVIHHSMSRLCIVPSVSKAIRTYRSSTISLRFELIKQLVSRGHNCDILDFGRRSLLHRVIQRHGCVLEEKLEWCPHNGTRAVQLFLSLGLDCNARDKNGDTPLHYAAYHQDYPIMQLLLEAGADIEARNNSCRTPLFETINANQVSRPGEKSRRILSPPGHKAMEMLLKNGANINARNGDGQTLLHQFSEAAFWEISPRHHPDIFLPLSWGLDVDSLDANVETAVQVANRLGKKDLAELIESLSVEIRS